MVVGSFIGFSCAWLIYHFYFLSPFAPSPGQTGNTAREVYAMELQRIPDEGDPDDEEPLQPYRTRVSQEV